MSPAERKQLRDLLAKATPGVSITYPFPDWELFNSARNALPGLLDDLAAAEAALAEAVKLRDHWHAKCGEADARNEQLHAEIARLKAGGCARDQRTTQYCAEAAAAASALTRLRKVLAEVANLNNSDDNGARRETARIIGEALRGGEPT